MKKPKSHPAQRYDLDVLRPRSCYRKAIVHVLEISDHARVHENLESWQIIYNPAFENDYDDASVFVGRLTAHLTVNLGLSANTKPMKRKCYPAARPHDGANSIKYIA